MPAKKRLRNYLALVVDRSSSISHYGLVSKVKDLTRSILNSAAENSRRENQETLATLITFADSVDVVYEHRNVESLPSFPYTSYGNTSLLDAMGKAITILEGAPFADSADTSFMVMAITDGEENHSTLWTNRLPGKIREVQETNRWTIAVQVPHGHKAALCRNFGIPEGNVREWEQTSRGVAETEVVTTAAFDAYYRDRSKGMTSTPTLFTDLSQVEKTDLKKLENVTHCFKTYVVDKEVPIRSFVEVKTGRDYVLGSTYYALTKSELIQPQKALLLQKKGEKTIYGGDKVRDLLGLPRGTKAKVIPKNHMEYEVYCQSTSPNRKLVRGTKILVDLTHTKDSTPTWDFTAGGTK